MFSLALHIISLWPTPKEQCVTERALTWVQKCGSLTKGSWAKLLISLYFISYAVKCQREHPPYRVLLRI